jgi:hypothetical protein
MMGFRQMKHYAKITFGILAILSTAAVALGQDSSYRGRKYKAPPPVSHVEVCVVRAANGKPVTNASVIFHPLVHGKDRGNMELKTDADGKALIDVIETGSTIRLQVIAPDFQTFGQDYKIDKSSMTLTIKLNRPSKQFTVYGDSTQNSDQKQSDGGQQGSGSSSKPNQ